MKIKLSLIALSLAASAAHASSQPREMAMGGTGVASGKLNTAAHTNPALLSSSHTSEVFSVAAPYLSVGMADDDKLIDALDEFQDSGVFDSFEMAIDSAELTSASLNHLQTTSQDLNTSLATLDNKALTANFFVGSSAAIATEAFGFALTASGNMDVSAKVNYSDGTLLDAFSDEVGQISSCLETDPASCSALAGSLTFIDPTTGDVNFDPESDLTSSVTVTGLAIAELAASFSTSFHAFDHQVSVGVTPKYVTAKTISYTQSVNDAEIEDFDADEYVTTYNNFNLDVGTVIEINDKWSAGLVVKNLFKEEYKSVDQDSDYTYLVEPHATVGVAYHGGWLNAAIDIDANKKFTSRGEEQVAAFGVEFDAFEIAQLRAGYRYDMENSDNSTYSAGVGFSPLGVHVDVGVAGNDKEVNASLMLGFKW